MAARAVVIGGSIAGLTSAIALARRGIEVEVIERDEPPAVRAGDAMEQWWRRGAPQARHTHIALSLARRTLLREAPDVLRSLLESGARELPNAGRLLPGGDWVSPHDDPELVGIACRRAILEDDLRRIATSENHVTVRPGIEVTGLSGTGTVTGVETSAGPIGADVVLDASGRASALLRWLADFGAPAPTEIAEPCGILYLSRFYRFLSHPDVTLNRGVAGGGDGPSSVCIVAPADDDTFSVTLGVPPHDAALRGLRIEGVFERAARLHPLVSPWIEAGVAEPISDVALMPGLQNRMRRFVVNGEPIAPGLLPVGDAVCITDPSYARGMSLAITHAFALADAVAEGLDDPHLLALRADDVTEELLRPWFDDALAGDRGRVARWSGELAPPPDGVTLNDIVAASAHDLVVQRAMLRRFNLLDAPDAIVRDGAVIDAVRAVMAAGVAPAVSGPSLDDLRELAMSTVAV